MSTGENFNHKDLADVLFNSIREVATSEDPKCRIDRQTPIVQLQFDSMAKMAVAGVVERRLQEKGIVTDSDRTGDEIIDAMADDDATVGDACDSFKLSLNRIMKK